MNKMQRQVLVLLVSSSLLISGCDLLKGGGSGGVPRPEPQPEPEAKSFLVTGRVENSVTYKPVAGAVVSLDDQKLTATTDNQGVFTFTIPDTQRPSQAKVSINADGFASNQIILQIPQNIPFVSVSAKVKPVTLRQVVSLASGISTGVSKPLLKSLGFGSFNGVVLSTPDGQLHLGLPGSTLRKMKSTLQASTDTLIAEITTGDPTRELDIMPGDFRAEDEKAKAELAASEIRLESVSFSEITLKDEAGNVVQPPAGSILPISMRLPDTLQETYKELFNQGQRFIPWYSYDSKEGVWKREKEAGLVMVDENLDGVNDTLYARAEATHFSWWNVDWPSVVRACIKVTVKDKNGLPVPGATVFAEMAGNYTQVNGVADSKGEFTGMVKRNTMVRLWAEAGGVKGEAITTTVSQVAPLELGGETGGFCSAVSLSLHPVTISGRVINQKGEPLAKVTVSASSGSGAISNEDGRFTLLTVPNSTIEISFSTTLNDITYTAAKTVTTLKDDVDIGNVVINTQAVAMTGSICLIKADGTEGPLDGAYIFADNGQKTRTSNGGQYKIFAAKNADSPVSLKVRIFYHDPTSGVDLSEDLNVVINPGDTSVVIPKTCLVQKTVTIRGQVKGTDCEKQGPLPRVSVGTSFGVAASTNNEGRYELVTPSDTPVEITATYIAAESGITTVQSITVNSGASDVDGIDFALDISTNSFIRGKVSDPSGRVIKNVDVLTDRNGRSTTDENGVYFVKAPIDKDIALAYSIPGVILKNETVRSLGKCLTLTHDVVLSVTSLPPFVKSVQLTPPAVQTGESAAITVSVADPDTSTLSYSITSGGGTATPSSGTISGADALNGGKFNFTWSAPSIEGWYTIVLTIDDQTGNSISHRINVEVKANRPPIILSMILSSQKVRPGDTAHASVIAFDPDGDTLNYSWTAPDAWGSSSLARVNLAIPVSTTEGSYPITATVSDNKGHAVSQSLTLLVVLNRPPAILFAKGEPTQIKSGEKANLIGDASDPDGDPLTFRWIQKGTGNVLSNEKTAVFTAPDVISDTPFRFVFEASDARATTVSQEVVVTVFPLGKNTPPSVTLKADRTTVHPLETVLLTATASDAENDPLTFTWSTSGGSVAGSGLTATWTAPSTTGGFTVTVLASDGKESTASLVHITVSEKPIPTVSGHVRDTSGNSVSRALVELYDQTDRARFDQQTATDTNGYYEYFDVPSGRYFLVVKRDGFTIESKEVIVP